MSTLYATPLGPNVKADGSIDIARRVSTNRLTPRVCVAHLTYIMTAAELAADVIRLWRAPQGTKILPHLSLVTSDGISTTATLNVGDEDLLGIGAAAVAARYAAAANVAAANARVLFSATGNPVAAVTPYELGSDAWITATFATLTVPVAAKRLEFLVFYLGA